MMVLNDSALTGKARDSFLESGFHMPEYDVHLVREKTKENPVWIHFGAGNIFRAFPAAVCQTLLNRGEMDRGIIVAEGYDEEIVDTLFTPHDNLSVLVTLKSNGNMEKTVIGSMTEALVCACDRDFERLREIFRVKSLQLASFTITEKGYSLVDGSGQTLASVVQDFEQGPSHPVSYIGKVTALCHARFLAGAYPLALVSMDNCSHNGDKLRDAVCRFAAEWVKNGFAEDAFSAYLHDPKQVSFPWTMIDKITPRPDKAVEAMLQDCGFADTKGMVTKKQTYIAPFVNAEETEWLIIEDSFPNGRPLLEKGGFLFTDRETVDKVEKMKVCTCLNPLHTALAVFGCLLGYSKLSDEMKDADLVYLIRMVGYDEGLPVVVDPEILSPRAFIDNVVEVRLPNPFMPDTPQRIACDTSQKIPIRFGETIKAYAAKNKADALHAIPVVLAGWLRYLLGIDDEGNPMECSPDPMLTVLTEQLADIALGQEFDCHTILSPLLSNAVIFGVDLYHVGLGVRVEQIFYAMTREKDAVRKALMQLKDKAVS